MTVPSIDPRTGVTVEELGPETTEAQAGDACIAAAAAFQPLREAGRAGRAALLRAIAAALEDDADVIIGLADRETALGAGRLTGELGRTCYQLRFFADVLAEGAYLDAVVDPPAETPMGPRPDLRRMLVPIGPVAVFGASNFPLAFSVPGGDTASALAAGCPVVAKAHPSHPATSGRAFAALRTAVAAAGLPPGTVGLVYGQAAGAALVTHPTIRAVGFTGSLRGGRALADLAAARPDPIPFHGELGSLNPVVVAPAAAQARPDAIAEGFAASMTLGVGQFCTKPGLLFAPAGPDGAALRAALVRAVGSTAGGVMLNAGIAAAYAEGRDRRTAHPGVRVLTAGDGGPVLHRVAAGALAGELLEECFGPASLLVEYADPDALAAALARLDGQLTATIHAEPSEADLVGRLMPLLVERAGRVVFDAYPTGVAVSWAMQHGGPWPASTSPEHTSVGAAAIRRWLRPVTYQNAPAWALPPELRDGNPEGIPRRLDGVSVSVNR